MINILVAICAWKHNWKYQKVNIACDNQAVVTVFTTKSQLLLLGSPYFIKKKQVITIAVGDSYIESVSAIRNLGAFFDEHMSMDVFFSQKMCCYSRAT